MRGSTLRQFPGDCPLTWAVLGINVLTFLVAFVGEGGWWRDLVFRTLTFPAQPWTALTYPLVADGYILGLLLGGYVFWLFGGSLERGWGRRDYAVFLGLTAAATAVGVWLGSALTGGRAVLAGLWMPLAGIVVAWSTINPYERVLAYFVIPIQARWLAAVAATLVVFSFPFPLGIFALAGPAVAWWYARGGRFFLAARSPKRAGPSRTRREKATRFTLNPVRLVQRWRQRRRLRRLWQEVDREKPDA